jgi:hypothetical protein
MIDYGKICLSSQSCEAGVRLRLKYRIQYHAVHSVLRKYVRRFEAHIVTGRTGRETMVVLN